MTGVSSILWRASTREMADTPPLVQYTERFSTAKAAYHAFGAIATHLAAARG